MALPLIPIAVAFAIGAIVGGLTTWLSLETELTEEELQNFSDELIKIIGRNFKKINKNAKKNKNVEISEIINEVCRKDVLKLIQKTSKEHPNVNWDEVIEKFKKVDWVEIAKALNSLDDGDMNKKREIVMEIVN